MPCKRTQKSTALRERMQTIHKIDKIHRYPALAQSKTRNLKPKRQQQWHPPRSKKKRIQKKWLKHIQQFQGNQILIP